MELDTFTQGKGVGTSILCYFYITSYCGDKIAIAIGFYKTLVDIEKDFLVSCRHIFVRVKTVFNIPFLRPR